MSLQDMLHTALIVIILISFLVLVWYLHNKDMKKIEKDINKDWSNITPDPHEEMSNSM